MTYVSMDPVFVKMPMISDRMTFLSECELWLIANTGDRCDDWQLHKQHFNALDTAGVEFVNDEDAIAFKLKFGL